MGIYIILMFLSLFLGELLCINKNKIGCHLYCSIMLVLIIIIAGFRSINVGVDTYQFCYIYNKTFGTITNVSQGLELTRFEAGFVFLCYFLSRFSNNYRVLLLVTSVIIFSCVMYFIRKNSKNIPFSIYLFIALNFFGMYMNVMRQALAIGIILIIYEKFLKEKKYFKYCLGVLVAMLFHKSAFIMLFLPLILKINFKPKVIMSAFALGVGFFLFGDKILAVIANVIGYGGYITKLDYFSSNYFGALLLFMVNLFIFIFCYFKKSKLEINELNLLKISFVGLIISLCTIKISIIGRINEYFNIFNIILIPNILVKTKNKLFIAFMMIILFFLYWYIIAEFRPEWHGVIPYERG